jgi:hypothetical protein
MHFLALIHKINYLFYTKQFVGSFFFTHLFAYLFSIILNVSLVDILLICIILLIFKYNV